MRPVIEQPLEPLRHDRGERGKTKDHQRQDRDRQHGELYFAALDLLPEIFGRPSDHQAGDEDRDDREQQEAVEARADAADDDFAEIHVEHRDEASDRGEAVMHRIDRAARCGRGHGREQRRGSRAEPHFLALHIAHGGIDAQRMMDRVASAFGDVGGADAGGEDDHHRGEDRPALPGIPDRLAERVRQARAEREDRQHLDHIRDVARVFERVRGVGVKETAAVGAKHLDRHLRSDRTQRNDLLGALDSRRGDRSGQRLGNAERNQHQRVNDADRQQDVEGDLGQIGPEIADPLGLAPGEAADQRECDRDARRRRQEVVHGEAGHLGEVRHGRFARVALPVGVGDEADGGVERNRRGDPRKSLGIERQIILQPLDRIGQDHARGAEQQHPDRVGPPVLVFFGVDPAGAVDQPFDRHEEAEIFRNPPFIEREQPGAERLGHRDGEGDENGDQDPAVRRRIGHQKRSGRASTATR